MFDFLKDRTILITGGTGFLGRALTKEILKYSPHSIRLFSRDEVKHHKVQELFNKDSRIKSLIGDVRDYERLERACEGVDIVIHAAALKRLDILEYNVGESIKTNILGVLNVVSASLKCGAEKAIFVSTDKACSPVNTYGACKFVGERIFTESNYNKGTNKTVFSCVRYGNVLESTGSVIPFFENKILNDQKVPLTDKRMTRFIISPRQAVELIFDSLRYSMGGEIFVPKLPAFRITDLIQILKEKHDSDAETELIGLRPGEKIHEWMINYPEIRRTYSYKNRYVIHSEIDKYHQLKEKPVYVTEGEKLDEQQITRYSSEDSVISKDEVKNLFKELGLL